MRRKSLLLALTVSVVGVWYIGFQQPAARVAAKHNEFWTMLTTDCGEDVTYFTRYNALAEYDGDVVALILSGLRSANPVVRWYAAYSSIAHMGTPQAPRLAAALRDIASDPILEVREAAAFGLACLGGEYEDHPWVHTSQAGGLWVYHRFHHAQYNDRLVWQIKDGRTAVLHELPGSIWNTSLSPDGRVLAVTHGGRQWGSTSLFDVETGAESDVLPWPYLEAHGVIVFGTHPRPDPYVTFREWSPDCRQALVSYGYYTPAGERMYGYAVYDTREEAVVRATMPKVQPDTGMPGPTGLGLEWH